ncbi:hypothetical protein AAF463_24065 (plasmid) [Pantoea sp. BJ2]|uniref:Uncharacterized protein n=1 Tax=Pantoea sp. BJ2 TaxID=3141322 RepID=A0AAU7U417_9GAMM
MPVLSEDPRSIHPAFKEAVVDSLLNGLSARLSGRGEFYTVIYGTKPVKALLSEFIVPMPAEEREGDEEADPVRISAHGMDFQIRSTAENARLTVSLTGALYLRILPTEDDVKPGGRLAPTFTLTREARAMLGDALPQLAQTLPGGKSDPEWEAKSHEVRSRIYASARSESEHHMTDGAETEEEEEDEEDIVHAGDVGHESLAVPDDMINDIPPPAKWVRLTLDLPGITFTPATAESDAQIATVALNQAIKRQLADWAASTDPESGGMIWG